MNPPINLRAHRKVIRATGIQIHSMASNIRAGRGVLPPDEPPGYRAAFVDALRMVAQRCERADPQTCSQFKLHLIGELGGNRGHSIDERAAWHALNALMNLLNLAAQRAGFDPFPKEGQPQ